MELPLVVLLSVGSVVWSVDAGVEGDAAELPPVVLPLVGVSVGLPAGALTWSVAVGAAASVEPSGWQAVRAVDSISTARAAPAFRAARGVGLIRGWLSLRCQCSSSVSIARAPL